VQQTLNPFIPRMKLEEMTNAALVKREMELKRLMRQMELDKLHTSTVFKNLDNELKSIRQILMTQDSGDSKK
jgi:hypothetical protein